MTLADALLAAAAELALPLDEAREAIIRDWLIGHGYIPFIEIDEGNEVAGTA